MIRVVRKLCCAVLFVSVASYSTVAAAQTVQLKNESQFKKEVQKSVTRGADGVEDCPHSAYHLNGAWLTIYNRQVMTKNGLKKSYDSARGLSEPTPKTMTFLGECNPLRQAVALVGAVSFPGTDDAKAFVSIEGNGGCEVSEPSLTVVATKSDDLMELFVRKADFLKQSAMTFESDPAVIQKCGRLEETYKNYKTDDWCLCFYKHYLSDPAKKAAALKEINVWVSKFELKN